MYNKTLIECYPDPNSDKITITIKGQYKGGGYTGMPETRDYLLQIHRENPRNVLFENQNLIEKESYKELNQEIDGWYFDSAKNLLYIKIKKQEATSLFSIQLFLSYMKELLSLV